MSHVFPVQRRSISLPNFPFSLPTAIMPPTITATLLTTPVRAALFDFKGIPTKPRTAEPAAA